MATDIGNAILLYGSLGLSPVEAERFSRAMKEFPVLLAKPPLEVTVPIRQMEPELLQDVQRCLGQKPTLADRCADLTYWLYSTYKRLPMVILACPKDHKLAKLARNKNGLAEWGATLGLLALVYSLDNPYVVWHEAMHLLGAEDCYDDAGRHTCPRGNCLMQYEPCKQTVKDWPFLCDANIQLVRIRARELNEAVTANRA